MVRLATRVAARYAAEARGGQRLAAAVAQSRAPKHLDASTRLARPRHAAYQGVARTPGSAGPPAAPPSPASSRPTWAPPEMSDFAAQWLFGDQAQAREGLIPMQAAENLPEPTPEQRIARFLARGGLERSRGAEILEGPAPKPASPDEHAASSAPEIASGPKRLSRSPAARPTIARTAADDGEGGLREPDLSHGADESDTLAPGADIAQPGVTEPPEELADPKARPRALARTPRAAAPAPARTDPPRAPEAAVPRSDEPTLARAAAPQEPTPTEPPLGPEVSATTPPAEPPPGPEVPAATPPAEPAGVAPEVPASAASTLARSPAPAETHRGSDETDPVRAATGGGPVRVARKPVAEPPARPRLRVTRVVPPEWEDAPQPVAAEPLASEPPESEVRAAARPGLLRRMIDAVRGRPPEPASPSGDAKASPGAASDSGPSDTESPAAAAGGASAARVAARSPSPITPGRVATPPAPRSSARPAAAATVPARTVGGSPPTVAREPQPADRNTPAGQDRRAGRDAAPDAGRSAPAPEAPRLARVDAPADRPASEAPRLARVDAPAGRPASEAPRLGRSAVAPPPQPRQALRLGGAASAQAGEPASAALPTAQRESARVEGSAAAAEPAPARAPGPAETGPPSTPLALARSALAIQDGAPERDAPTPATAPPRPHLALSPKPPPEVRPTPPVIARASAERLVAETQGWVEDAEDGMRTVSFPVPGGGGPELARTPVTPYTISRELADPAPPAAAPPAADAPATGQAGGGLDLEAAYEYFLDRFKRDLVVEREQSGHLLNDNP